VVPPPEPRRARAFAGEPGIAGLLGDAADVGAVQVTADDDGRMTRGIGENGAQLLHAPAGTDVERGAEVGRVHSHAGAADLQRRHGRNAVRTGVARCVWQNELGVADDRPAREHGVSEVAARSAVEERGVVDVPHPEGFGDAPRPRRIHFLEQEDVGLAERGVRRQQCDGSVDVATEGDVERHDPQGVTRRRAPGFCGGRSAGIPRLGGTRVVAAGAARGEEQ
jgi:hypothetical protein